MKIPDRTYGLRTPVCADDIHDSLYSRPIPGRIDLVPFFIAASFFVDSILTFCLYGLQGRYTIYIPPISETSTTFPNNALYSVLFTIDAFLLGILLTIYISACDAWNLMSPTYVFVGRLLTIISPFCLVVLSCVTIEDQYMTHMIATQLFFASVIVFFATTFFALKKKMTRKLLIGRALILILALISFSVMLVVATLMDSILASSIYAVSEYLLAFTFLAYLMTMKTELSLIHLQVMILNENYSDE